MPNSTFPAVISFGDNKKPIISARFGDENDEDFSTRMENAIEVQEIAPNLYLSKELWLPAGARGVFGGQIVAQALRAAFYTVGEEFEIHSLHSYFILAGSVDTPVVYQVQRIREGRSYATRYVTASQKGKAIFVCSCSFAKPDTKNLNLSHQVEMPIVPPPETYPSEQEAFAEFLTRDDLAPKYREAMEQRMMETSPVDFRHCHVPGELTGFRYFKTRGKLRNDKVLHACVIAYASDHAFINAATDANAVPMNAIGMLTSLDHCIWFHSNARTDEWLLYDMHSPRASNGRGIVFGRIYAADGTLVATTSQEGIMRLTEKEQENRMKSKL
ncbi:hypothetical protein G6F46_000327 [Rhizopus delemar]|uniref:Acyl-CoA thioesterase II n=2 Tax=Rhizopus TaxID=4842 RepID=A0A9P6YZS2_9FUNG|nr:hypothetical protein G6F55_004496 [Rhizopus delemar]KAG1540406.1 hypothetical protein G6F51_008545 [Rhizopus arrhizus]KAG1501020.1 hypothetical protein G6F53_011178 [Rhizopus delemar]KAG1505451.1 hypothetical protein G6F54_000309 [Rhizopus delemar]KAG1520505.1 hypothetical protein G6F52_007598 [Rhizopus delemar]